MQKEDRFFEDQRVRRSPIFHLFFFALPIGAVQILVPIINRFRFRLDYIWRQHKILKNRIKQLRAKCDATESMRSPEMAFHR